MNPPRSYESLGKFYLGRNYDIDAKELSTNNFLYDSKDLVTHAMCVGMTGSGKTGLCLSLLEEAAIDGIPAICVDPKGDLGNLLLTFPELQASDFLPWLDASEAAQKGMSLDELASQSAETWKKGLEKWDQDGARIQRFRESVDINIYTPGSTIGLPLTILKSFDAPPQSTLDDPETLRERVASSAAGLLALLGIEADPLTSPQHILLSKILDATWKKNQSLDLGELIRLIQTPPFDRVGVVDLETFLPTAERIKLAMNLNNLLAAPSFAGWLEGEPLNIKNLLYTPEGKPRLSILSIAHLNDAERMFFVTILLGELLSWMRAQPGTGSLRAIFYMDEVYGYFPPSAKPPSKPPMLTLLKQARAFGLGIVLATQNPVDLDYKGLSNMGTWFLGRLQTQRDKDRVLDGLEGAAAQSGKGFDRAAMERNLSALGARVFLINNVHQHRPEIFQSRWALSFLRGPLSREHIQRLMKEKRSAATSTAANFAPTLPTTEQGEPSTTRPIVPANIAERFAIHQQPRPNHRLIYRPTILGQTSVHYVRASGDVDHWEDVSLIVPVVDPMTELAWEKSVPVPAGVLKLSLSPEPSFQFASLPAAATSAKNFSSWEKELKEHLFRKRTITIYYSPFLKKHSLPGQGEAEAREGFRPLAAETLAKSIQSLRGDYDKEAKKVEEAVRTAEKKLETARAKVNEKWWNSILNAVTLGVGVLMSKNKTTKTNMNSAASAARKLGQATASRAEVAAAEAGLEEKLQAKQKLDEEHEKKLSKITAEHSVENLVLEPVEVSLRKADTRVNTLAVLWIPWQIDPHGIATPLIDLDAGLVGALSG